MESYQYMTPPGFGDTFYAYTFNGNALGNGNSPSSLRTQITNGDFILRAWAGLETVADKIQLYDHIYNAFGSLPVAWGKSAKFFNVNKPMSNGIPVLPEKWYPDFGKIVFDLVNTSPYSTGTDNAANNVYQSQLAFYGVRRRKGVQSDPQGSDYAFTERPRSYQATLTLNSYQQVSNVATAPVLLQTLITDYDFELRRIFVSRKDSAGANTGKWRSAAGWPSTFSANIYSGNQERIFSNPLYSALFVASTPLPVGGAFNSPIPLNSFPAPGIMFRVNSNINMEIFSGLCQSVTADTVPVNLAINFDGVERIPTR